MTPTSPRHLVLRALLFGALLPFASAPLRAQSGWERVPSGTAASLNRISWISSPGPSASAGFLYVAGDSGVFLASGDIGRTWSAPAGIPQPVNLNGLAFPLPDTGYLVGDGGTILKVRRIAGVFEFTELLGAPGAADLNAVSCVPLSITAYVVGDSGTMFRTVNRGETWVPHNTSTQLNINGVKMATVSRIFACGDSGLVLRSFSSGNWVKLPVGGVHASKQLCAIDVAGSLGDTAWIVGEQGTVLHSRNTGASTPTWIASPTGVSVTLRGVRYVRGTVWAVGDSGVILKSSNGGSDWTRVESGTTDDLYDVVFTDEWHGVIVGENGTILRTISAGEYRPISAHPVHLRFGRIPPGSTRYGLLTVANTTADPVEVTSVVSSHPSFTVSPAGATIPARGEWQFTVGYSPEATGPDTTILSIQTDGGSYTAEVPAGGECADSLAEPGWTWLNPKPQGNPLSDVEFFDAFAGVAVGWSGTVVRTTDGGTTWTSRHGAGGTDSLLRCVAVTGHTSAVAVGGIGAILHTSDRGANWSARTGPLPLDRLVGVSFHDADTGYTVASEEEPPAFQGWKGAIYKTTDAASSWSRVFTSGGPYRDDMVIDLPLAVAAGAPGNAIAVGYKRTTTSSDISGSILRTTDGGVTWNRDNGAYPRMNALAFAGDSVVVVVGDNGTVVRSTDGGENWAVQPSLTAGNLGHVAFSGPNDGIVADIDGNIFTTSDGGLTWAGSTIPGGAYAAALSYPGPGVVVAVDAYARITTSDDNGATWTDRSSSVGFDRLVGVAFRDASYGVAISPAGRIIRSSDGGATWAALTGGTLLEHVRHPLASVSYHSPDVITVVGSFGTILRSTDGGLTWDERESGTNQPLTSVSFEGPETGYIVGSFGTILRTSDGGMHWSGQKTSHGGTLTGVDPSDEFTVTAAGPGAILHSTDGGRNWQSSPEAAGLPLYDVALAGQYGAAVGAGGVVLGTTDGGATWSDRASPTGQDLRRVELSATGFGTAVGTWGTIIRTTDGGLHWFIAPSGTPFSINDVSFIDDLTGVVVGDYGAILRTVSGGLGSNAATDVPRPATPLAYRLDQNYPNPFNPVTTIRFRLPVESRMVLRVYDMLGRVVATLVDGVRQAGDQSVTWDARGVASGVYVYRLEATAVRSPGENFTRDSRMVLVR